MARKAVPFFLLAIAAAFFSLTGIAGLSSITGWVLLPVFVVLFILRSSRSCSIVTIMLRPVGKGGGQWTIK